MINNAAVHANNSHTRTKSKDLWLIKSPSDVQKVLTSVVTSLEAKIKRLSDGSLLVLKDKSGTITSIYNNKQAIVDWVNDATIQTPFEGAIVESNKGS